MVSTDDGACTSFACRNVRERHVLAGCNADAFAVDVR
jgi:hypothetical protein